MKCSRRLLLSFVVCVLLLGTFSIPAAAESSTKHNFALGFDGALVTTQQQVMFSGDNEMKEVSANPTTTIDENTLFQPYIYVANSDGTSFAKKGKQTTINLHDFGFYYSGIDSVNNRRQFPMGAFENVHFVVAYTDGTQEQISGIEYKYNSSLETLSYTITFTPSKDVRKIAVRMIYRPMNAASWLKGLKVDKFGVGGYKLQAEVTQQTEEAGLLGGLLQWVKDIFNKIGDTFTEIKNGFANIGQWFAELPAKLWEKIETGLKSLFVPSEDYMVQFKEKLDTLLEEKLGAVYQVVDITLNSWDSIKEADTQNTIDFPKSTISFKDGTNFSFGGYKVNVVPYKFEGIASTLKVIVGIVCTILFINGLRKRYDEIMGVEK